MRTHTRVFAAACLASSSSLAAAAPPFAEREPAPGVTIVKASAIAARIEATPPSNAGRGGIFAEADGWRVHVADRDRPGLAELHDADTDVWYVIEGGATVVTGGALVEATVTGPGEQRAPSIRGGTEHKVAAGDVVTIAPRVPHWVKAVDGRLKYLVVKVQQRPAAAAAPASATAPEPTALAEGVHLVRGGFQPGSQPDGNTVVFRGPSGLVVVDSGRHAAHTDRVIALARAQGAPVAAVVNTHWHLDHVSGNPALKAAFPGIEVHATDAIRAAMTGFLAAYRRQLAEMVARPGPAEARRGLEAELARIDAGAALFPDRPVTASGSRTLAGRAFDLHLERAATQGDVWLFDPQTRILVAGDLVTLPAPFLDTGCPARWREALSRIAAADFSQVVPGHGPPLSRSQLEAYRRAFDNLISCGASPRPQDDCVNGWIADAGTLVPEAEKDFARSLARYYVEAHLRGDPAKAAALCR